MSAFELWAWDWHLDHVTPATIKAGLVAKFWPELEETAAHLFLLAYNAIEAFYARIRTERQQDKK